MSEGASKRVIGRGSATSVSAVEAGATAQVAQVVHHDPVWVVQCAWSVLRLGRLQELIRSTIVDLQSMPQPELPQPELVGGESAETTRLVCDPGAEALRACCEELRDACGMPGAEADRALHCRAVRAYIEHEPLAWSEAFSMALERYRRAAARSLEHALARAVA